MFVVAGRDVGASRLIDVALVYEVLGAFGIALAETLASYEPDAPVRGVSWVCLWIALFPLVVPSTPGKTLVAALASASMGGAALGVASYAGVPLPSTSAFFLLVTPNFLAAGLAVFLARLIHQLGSDVQRAMQMGSYQLIELLGRGGMGEVWRARHRMLAQPAAIKLVSPEVLGGRSIDIDTVLKRFEREAQATAKLNSQHTIQIFDFGRTDDGTLYYVMELLEGIDLESLVLEHGPLPPERVVYLLRQVCESLAEAHDHGMVHRDIKPANIYVCKLGTRFDRIKVLDFGIVAIQEELSKSETRLTADDAITGTPAYMAPETVTHRHRPDHRIDIYALGCVAYWLLTGSLVFEADSPVKMIYGHVSQAPDPPSKRVDTPIPAALEQLVLECLAKDPTKRPASANEMARRLEALAPADPWTEQRALEWWEGKEVSSRLHATSLRRPNETVVPAR
jgi:serine/threonine-protein kinase